MKRLHWLLLALAGVIVGTVAALVTRMKTGVPAMDRLRIKIALELIRVFGFKAIADARYGRAMMAILKNESGGNPKHYLGDVTASGGPSIGPLQVYRKSAKDYGLWQPSGEMDERAEYTNRAQDEAFGIKLGVEIFARKLKESGGDFELAIRRYNGSGAAAEAYRDRALAFARDTWGGFNA